MRLLERVKKSRRWKEMQGEAVKRGWKGGANVEEEMWEETVREYVKMYRQRLPPHHSTFPSLLKACALLRLHFLLNLIHLHVIVYGFQNNQFAGNALLATYAKFGLPHVAHKVFDKMPLRNVVSWNTMIAAYMQNGDAKKALEVFGEMEEHPDAVTIASVLPACGLLGCLPRGKEIHAYAITTGLDTHFLHNALLYMYAKCGSLDVARQLFLKMPHRDVVSWNVMVAGFAQNGQYEDSLNVLSEMHNVAALKPNSVTIASVVPALAYLGRVRQGKAIHSYAIKCGYESHISAMNSLMDMYVKCGSMEDARQLFDNTAERDVVSWNTIIGGYALAGYSYDHSKKNLSLNLNLMILEGVIPDSVTVINIVSGCGQAGALEQGRRVHSYLIRNGFESHLSVGNALVDMYAKCGYAEAAHQVFSQMPLTDVISWNTMIGGYGMNGLGSAALDLFYKMQQQGLKPNSVTFVAILSACSHAGLVTEGLQKFDSITQHYHIAPSVEHYACVVDLLGRGGRLDDAHSMIGKMPAEVEADARVWGALLGGCRIHRNLQLGKCVAEHLFQIEPKNTGNYLVLANMYAACGMWEQSIHIRTIMNNKGLRKTPGYSWVEAKNTLHVFRVGDQSHPQSKEIYATLERLSEQMEGAGYMADTTFALINVEEEERDRTLNVHSEKLAIAFGLISIPCGTPIRISKNLRMCGDCHNATKFISRIACREIIVRDSHRFHHFKDGLCSCGNYW